MSAAAGCPTDEGLARFAHGPCSEGERAEIERHLDTCLACAELLAALGRSFADEGGAPSVVRLDRYELGAEIGAGAMGRVFSARDPVLHRALAIKVIPPGPLGSGEALLREARAMARVSHSAVVAVHDAGELPDGHVFIAMDLVRGPSLQRHLALHPDLPSAVVLSLFVQVGRGLAAAHEAGVVHRDFKPANVLLDLGGPGGAPRAWVTDFGLAHPVKAASAPEEDGPRSVGRVAWEAHGATSHSSARGTPAYMSPEQLDRGDVGPASDQFSFCVALFEALYHRHPFPGRTLTARREAVRRGPQLPTEHDVPAYVGPLLARGLRERPDQRWPSLTALLDELELGAGRRAEWQLTAHAFGLFALSFLHAAVSVGIAVAAASTPNTPDPLESSWERALAAWVAILFVSGWLPLGAIASAACGIGLLKRRRWAYVATTIYAVTACLSGFLLPYGLLALYSLRRPPVQLALGRLPKQAAAR